MHLGKRERLIPALNYRYTKYTAALMQATPPVEATPAMVQRPIDASVVVPGEAAKYQAETVAVNEMGQMVGAYLSSDHALMKSFMIGLVAAFTTK